MQFEANAALGSGGWDVDEVRLERGEVWRKPPKALLLAAAAAMVMVHFKYAASGWSGR